MAERACGNRVAGGIYATVGLGLSGHPIECFLTDLPRDVPWQEMGLSEIGVHAIRDQKTGIVNLWDIIGRNYYPFVADFIEEARRLGISRRVPSSLPWHQIDSRSRLILLHSRAVIRNAADYADREPVVTSPHAHTPGWRECPNRTSFEHCRRARPKHQGRPLAGTFDNACARFWWQDVDADLGHPGGGGTVHRQVCETVRYRAVGRDGRIRPVYRTGTIGVFPITNLTVIRDPQDATHRVALDKVQRSGLSVAVENE